MRRQILRYRTDKNGNGFTLVELLVAMPLMLIAGGVVVYLMYNYVNLFFMNNDTVVASQRAEMVFRLLDEPVHHAGLGINTGSESIYKKAWGDQIFPNAPFPAVWGDSIVLSGDEVSETYNSIGILYAVPTGLKVSNKIDSFTKGNDFTVDLIEHNIPASVGKTGDAKDLRSWMTIPGTNRSVPMFIKAYDVTNKQLTAEIRGDIPNNFEIPMNQELYRMKALMAYVVPSKNGRYEFRVVDITDSPAHYDSDADYVTIIDNIRAARFRLSPDRKFLELRVLGMGDTVGAKHSQVVAPALRSRWSELTDDDAKYYLEEFEIKWRVRDLYDARS